MPPQKLHYCEPQDIGKLPNETKQMLLKYDCDCVPLFENRLGAEDARDNLASLWAMQLVPTSPTNSSGQSVPASLQSDPSVTTTPQTKNPSFFESFCSEHVFWILGFDDNRQGTPIISMLSEANFDSLKIPTQQIDTGDLTVTPNNMQTPKFAAHQKKRNLTLHYVNYLKTNSIALSFMILLKILVISLLNCVLNVRVNF